MILSELWHHYEAYKRIQGYSPNTLGSTFSFRELLANFQSNSVIVQGKGNKKREVWFNTRCSIWLQRYLDERQDKESCLFYYGQKAEKTIEH